MDKRNILCLIAGLALAPVTVPAQTIRTLDHQPVLMPSQFIVSPDGIEYLREGRATPIVAPWDKIDLNALAKEEPQIERARQKAILTKQRVYVTVPKPANYYVAFLKLPVNATFPTQTLSITQDTSIYNMSAEAFSTSDGAATSTTVDGFIAGTSTSRTKTVDLTRYPLCTTIEGLFMTLAADSNPDSKKLILDLEKQSSFFPNLILGLKDLAALYPKDPEIKETILALEKFTTGDVAVSVDSQRQLASFVAHCHAVKM
jgi:hypothetical protein